MTAPKNAPGGAPRRSMSPAPSGIVTFLGSPAGVFVVVGLAVVVVAALVLLSGVLAPTTPVAVTDRTSSDAPADATRIPADPSHLTACGGVPCPAVGSESAAVTVIEVTDYACGYCRDFHATTIPNIVERYAATGRIRFVSHVYAVGPKSEMVMMGALCAGEQDRYFEFQKRAYADDVVSAAVNLRQAVIDLGKSLVPDPAAFEACYGAARHTGAITRSTQEATAGGVAFTPSLFVNDLLIEGALEDALYESKIEAALAEAAPSS